MPNSTKVTGYYDYLFVELADPRTENWLFMRDPSYILAIVAFYFYFVISLGPKLMKNRKPFTLTRTLIIYNLLQVLISVYLVAQGIMIWRRFNWRCEPIDYSNNPQAIKGARLVHIYFLAKISELLDTVFFVLRKKNNQITFLHLYHHTSMPMFGWFYVKYIAGGHGTFMGLINSFVHVIMYSYYLLAAIGPQFQKYLWWKKYITTLQLAQFCVAFIHNSQLLFVDCGYPKWTLAFTLPNAIFFYYLFYEFYNMAYSKTEKNEKIKQAFKNGKVKSNNNNAAKIKTK